MNVFPSGDVGDVPAANAQPVVDGSENVKGVPTSLTDLGFSSEFERQLQLENDPELKFISLHELDNDDVFLALHDIIVTPNTNMAYGHVDSEMTVMDSTPNMVHSHVFSSGENPPFNFGYDQFFSSADKGKGVVVDETPSHNFVLDHVGPYKEREVVTPTLDMANVDYDFPFEEMGDDQSQELQPPSVLFTTDLKPRLRWTFELHQCFLKAVNDLGGPKKACPKDILNSMKVEGLTLYHVKSHLQKYRQNPDSVSQWCEMNQNVQSSLGSQVPQGSSSSLGSSSLGENLSSYDNNKGKSKVGEGSASGLYAPVEPANISTRFQEAQSNYLNNSLRNAQRMLSYPYYGYGGATIGSGSYYGHDFNTMGRVPTLYQNLINSYNTYYGMGAYRQPTVSFPAAPFPTSPSLGYTRGSFSPYSQVPRNFYQESSRNLYQETFRNLYQERLRNLYQEGFSANPGRANKRARTSGI